MLSKALLGERRQIGLPYVRPIIETLQKMPDHRARKADLKNDIVKNYGLPDGVAEQEMPSHRNTMLSDMGNARSTLVLAGLLQKPNETKKGVWALTDAGRNAKLDDADAERLYHKYKPYSKPAP